jgi:2-C-methyl-D-erythritol 4-phosphate cytidylyltransferase
MSNSPSTSPRLYVVIPCAGTGSRAQTQQPKQYERILGLPMVVHTLRAFQHVGTIERGVVVVAPDDRRMASVLRTHPDNLFDISYNGGASRAQSVLGGLKALQELGANESDWVLVHDAARCLVTPENIQKLIDKCLGDQVGGLLALPVADTLKSESAGRVVQTIDRTHKWQAQTPQMFRLKTLLAALESFPNSTDEASAVERLGLMPRLVQASLENFKVTFPQDFELAQAILSLRAVKGSPAKPGEHA